MKKVISFFLGLSIIASAGLAFGQTNNQQDSILLQPQGLRGWMQVQSGTTQQLGVTAFPTKDTAFAFAGGGIGTLRSIDGGLSWQLFATPIIGLPVFNDNKTGYVFDYEAGSNCYYTLNGGQTWTQSNDSNQAVVQAVTLGPDTAYLIGNRVNRTTDGGKNWSSPRAYAGDILAGAFYDSQHGITVGRVVSGPGPMHQGLTGSCYTTGDGGLSWTQQYTGVPATFDGVTWLSPTTIVAISGEPGYVSRSANSGQTWDSIPLPHHYALRAIQFKQGRILTVGSGGSILTSKDSGLTWLPEVSGVTSDLTTIEMLNDSTALAGGDAGVILRTTNGGTDWVQVAPPSLVQLLTRVRYISETPFIEIEYSLPQLQDVTIRLFDLLGKEIETLETRKLESAGPHRIRLDTSHLPSGTYLYRIETERYSGAGKFVIAK